MRSTNSPYLYASEQEAHDDLMRIAIEVLKEIRANGDRPPPVSKLVKDLDKLWSVFRLFAPKGHHETKTGTQL